jgi:hypothetical protein
MTSADAMVNSMDATKFEVDHRTVPDPDKWIISVVRQQPLLGSICESGLPQSFLAVVA